MLSSAIAAGFVLVVGAFTLHRPGSDPAATATEIARNDIAPVIDPRVRPVSLPEPEAALAPIVADGKMIRDARLDRYLAAHKQFAGSSALGVPSTFLRSATVESGSR